MLEYMKMGDPGPGLFRELLNAGILTEMIIKGEGV